ncbi:MAG: TetR/AcrR family transcriptional regulator [Solirubrobacteraceae bacterium]|nr:TetR/AcrR family transcriptional regulator [Solirubrobacteraceae bacterium]
MAGSLGMERVYGGLTAEQRDERRRGQLLDAGLEVFSERGWDGATVHDVCKTAGLSQRYFYDHFADRQELFLEICRGISGDIDRIALAAAVSKGREPLDRVADVLGALAGYFQEDPRRVRVSLVESMATPELRQFRSRMLGTSATLAARLMLSIHPMPARADTAGIALSARVLSGGIAELLVAAAAGEVALDPDAFIAHLTRLYTAAAALDVNGAP